VAFDSLDETDLSASAPFAGGAKQPCAARRLRGRQVPGNQALSNSPDVRPIAEEAVHDPSEVVSNQALDILNRLDAQANPPQPSSSANPQQGNQLPAESQQAP
jgi:hypothetical protein